MYSSCLLWLPELGEVCVKMKVLLQLNLGIPRAHELPENDLGCTYTPSHAFSNLLDIKNHHGFGYILKRIIVITQEGTSCICVHRLLA